MQDKQGLVGQEAEKVHNQPFDEAVDVDDSGKCSLMVEEVESGSDNDMSQGAVKNPANFGKIGSNIEYPGVDPLPTGA